VTSGVFLYVAKFKSRFERQREKDKNASLRKFERLSKFPGINLYIKNLDDSIDEDFLRDLFSKFGSVLSTRVMRDPSGASRGFGFVSFTHAEEARRAILEMNNYPVWSKPIKVHLALTREQRSAQNQFSQQSFNRGGVPYPPVFGLPMYMHPNQPVANPTRPYPMMQMMQRPSPQRPQVSYRSYPIPSYAANQFPQTNQIHPGQQQLQPQSQQLHAQPQFQQAQQHPQNFQRKTRGVKPVINRPQKSAQIAPSRANEQGPIHQEINLNQPLTSQFLASVAENQRKYMIGERLFPKINQRYSHHAPKITGMLLEMENTELLHLLETDSALNEKIDEAVRVLENFTQKTN
jgi:polyadenylate-binding protein